MAIHNKILEVTNPAALDFGKTRGRFNLGADTGPADIIFPPPEASADAAGKGKATEKPTLVFPAANLFPLPFFQLNKTTTQLARGAIKQLQDASAGTLNEAIKTVKNKGFSPGGLINKLERKVKIGEVLNELANDWDNETKEDFAEAFNMAATKHDVMDSIVSLAILNDPDLEGELLAENTPETSEAELMDNRRIVWQHPQPGTPLEPPYLMMVAVEYQDIADAREVADSILEQLTTREGFKLPNDIAARVR